MSAVLPVRWGKAAAAAAAKAIRNHVGSEQPVTGLILGSGLAGLADRFADARRVSYGDVPGFPVPGSRVPF